LTVGDSFLVNYNNKRYHIDVVEAKPANAISIVETDCEVDFTEPLDYVEPEKDYGRPAPAPATAPVVAPFGRPPSNKGTTYIST
jgi:ubiquitin fusion degradation protein 1